MSEQTPQAQTVPRYMQPFAIASFFAVVGPLVGLAAFVSVLLGFLVIGIFVSPGPGAVKTFMNILMTALIGIPFAYFYGFIPSAIAGLSIGLLRLCMTRVPWYLALLVGLGVGATFTIANRRDTILGWPGDVGRWPDHLLNVFPCVAGALVCWAVVRKWFVPPQAGQIESQDKAKTK